MSNPMSTLVAPGGDRPERTTPVAAIARTLADFPPFPAEPDWCVNCYGGTLEVLPTRPGYPERSVMTGRLHERTLFTRQLPDADMHRATVEVRVLVERLDDPGEIVQPTRIVLVVGRADCQVQITPDPAQARQLAAALIEAADVWTTEQAGSAR